MWLTQRPRMDSKPDAPHLADVRYQPTSKQHVANFSYPRTDFSHTYRKEQQPAIRDSRGSESSPPPMVDDHGSDLSVDEDSQYRVSGADLWDSWHTRDHQARKPHYPALIKLPAKANFDHGFRLEPPLDLGSQRSLRTSGPSVRAVSQGSQTSCPSADLPYPEHGPSTAKLPPKACYSLFPPADLLSKRAPLALQTSEAPHLPGLDPSPLSVQFPLTPNSRSGITDRRGHTGHMYRPSSSRVTTPNSVHGGSIAASSSDSIPLLLRSGGPSPPASPSDSSSEARSSCERSLRPKRRSPSHTNLRKFSLTNVTTRSSPSLANLAKAHRQEQPTYSQSKPPTPTDPQSKPPTPTDLCDRPLPPLPTERPPSPPHISVFETDSDDEGDDGGGKGGARSSSASDTRSFARRFMQSLVHHHHHQNQHNNRHDSSSRRDKSPGPDHKRSVSDEGPSSTTNPKETRRAAGSNNRAGLSRTLNAALYRRGGCAGGMADPAEPTRAAVSMELPRDAGDGGSKQHPYQQVGEDGEEKTGRFWGGGNDFFLGRILRRRG